MVRVSGKAGYLILYQKSVHIYGRMLDIRPQLSCRPSIDFNILPDIRKNPDIQSAPNRQFIILSILVLPLSFFLYSLQTFLSVQPSNISFCLAFKPFFLFSLQTFLSVQPSNISFCLAFKYFFLSSLQTFFLSNLQIFLSHSVIVCLTHSFSTLLSAFQSSLSLIGLCIRARHSLTAAPCMVLALWDGLFMVFRLDMVAHFTKEGSV